MATIRDIAKAAGVSTATVSHVLNDTRRVAPTTRAAVLDAVERLGYRPNAVARSLTTSETKTIGVMVANIAFPFFAELVRGLEHRLVPHGYTLMVCNTDETAEREAHTLEEFSRRRVDGVLAIATITDHPMLEVFARSGTPLVFLDRQPAPGLGHFVGMDNEAAGYLATRHLVDLGHEDIALLARSHRFSTMRGRLEGYRRALREAGLPERTQLVRSELVSVEDAARGADELLAGPERPSALIATNYTMTLGVLAALQRLGLRYPDDVSLVCFDDSPWARVLSPPLTVIDHPVEAICDSAAELMLRAIAQARSDASEPLGLRTSIHPGVLRARASSAPYRAPGPAKEVPS